MPKFFASFLLAALALSLPARQATAAPSAMQSSELVGFYSSGHRSQGALPEPVLRIENHLGETTAIFTPDYENVVPAPYSLHLLGVVNGGHQFELLAPTGTPVVSGELHGNSCYLKVAVGSGFQTRELLRK